MLVIAICAVLFIPFPWYEEAAFYVEPVDVAHVYTAVPGFLNVVHVEPGDDVKEGEVIAELSNPELLDQEVALGVDEETYAIEPKLYLQLNEAENRVLAQRQLETIREQRIDVTEQLGHLKLVAPCSGTVLSPRRRSRPPIEKTKNQLTSWYGVPMHGENVGAFLDEQTHVCSIAPSDQFRAIVLISQSDRRDLELDDRIRLKFDHLPHRVFDGTVVEFSDRHLEFAPPALSNKYGGPLSTVTDAEGREQLAIPVYQVMVDFETHPPDIRSGMRGVSRFVVDKRTLFDWLWRWFRQTFHFRL